MAEMRGWWMLCLTGPLLADPRVDFARGVLEQCRGGDGGRYFEKALAQDPEAWPLVWRVGEGRLAKGDIAGASSLFRDFARAHPQRLDAQVRYADFLREASPDDDFAAKLASETLENALVHHPGDLGLIRRLFRTYEQRGMRDRSMELFEKVAATPGTGAALAAAEMARNLFPGDDGDARTRIDRIFRKAMDSDPADPTLARAASEHFRESSRMPEAIAMLEMHVAAAPVSLDLRVRLGVLYFAAKRDDDGLQCLTQVLEIDPRRALAHQSLAKFHRQRGDAAKAMPHAVEVLKIRGGDATEFTKLAAELRAAGEVRQARLLLEKGIFDHPRDAEIATLLAILSREDPETRSLAASRFREAEALSGPDGPAAMPDFQIGFAEFLIESGDNEAAEKRLQDAIKAYPPEAAEETAAALRKLAALWESENRNAAAAAALRARADAMAPADSK
jgi:tetratricopeptide (TPR) repeat protein